MAPTPVLLLARNWQGLSSLFLSEILGIAACTKMPTKSSVRHNRPHFSFALSSFPPLPPQLITFLGRRQAIARPGECAFSCTSCLVQPC